MDPRDATVRLARTLDYAEVQTLNYVIQAKDGANASTTATLTINVLDDEAQGPRFNLDQYNAKVPELDNNLLPAITIYVSIFLPRQSVQKKCHRLFYHKKIQRHYFFSGKRF